MGAASVNIKEVDLSTRVASFEGVFGAIVIPAKKGRTDKPFFVSSDTQLLSTTTADGAVKVGDDLSYFSALAYLERANKLWVKRAINAAFFGGLVIKEDGEAAPNAAIPPASDVADPSAFVMAAVDALFIHGSSEGAWANDIGIKITTVVDDPDLVEPNSFLIEVFKASNQVVPEESFLVSRVLGQKDGRGLNMFVEDVLEGSSYIRAISNPLVAETVLPNTQATILDMGDGQDGLAVNDAIMITAVNTFLNKAETNITLLMDGGWATPAFGSAINVICQTRQDCMGILSVPFSDEDASTYMTDIVSYRKTELNLNTSYAALYTPHLQIQDRFNDRAIWIAPDGHIAGSISFSAQNFEIWFPPAGFRRGVLSVLDARRRFEDGEMDVLADAGINPIRFIPGKGIVVWGQKTLLARASALDRVNVRLLLIVIEPAIKELLENFLFELNDASVRSIIETKIESYLEGIKARKGVQDFDVVADDTNNTQGDIDANRLNVDIFIKPSLSIEDIPVRVVITPSNISFSDAAGAI